MKRGVVIGVLLLLGGVVVLAFREGEEFEGKVVEFYRLFVGKFPHEKLYVHTDREAYEVGDTVVLEGVTRKGQVCRLRKELKVEY